MNDHIDTAITATAEENMTTSAFLSAAGDTEVQRGRKRIRRTEGLESRMRYNTRRKQTPSGESGNLRGRSRHRSTSVVARSRSRNLARDRNESGSPSKEHILRIVQLSRRGRRRSQSPSRSYTPRDVPLLLLPLSTCRRRRQRTRSRSRDHFLREHSHCHYHHHHHAGLMTTSVELKSPLCSEVVVSDHDDGDRHMSTEGALDID
ncbi:hypothetical protein V8F06_008434 [Rhypophila decipiens]